MSKLLRRLFAVTALLCLGAGPNWCQPCEDPSQLFCAQADQQTESVSLTVSQAAPATTAKSVALGS